MDLAMPTVCKNHRDSPLGGITTTSAIAESKVRLTCADPSSRSSPVSVTQKFTARARAHTHTANANCFGAHRMGALGGLHSNTVTLYNALAAFACNAFHSINHDCHDQKDNHNDNNCHDHYYNHHHRTASIPFVFDTCCNNACETRLRLGCTAASIV